MAQWLQLDEDDLADTKRTGRLSTTAAYGEPPATIEDASDPQKRLIAYLKIFRRIFGVGQRGVRIALPLCVVARVRRVFPEGVSVAMDNSEDSALEGESCQ